MQQELQQRLLHQHVFLELGVFLGHAGYIRQRQEEILLDLQLQSFALEIYGTFGFGSVAQNGHRLLPHQDLPFELFAHVVACIQAR